MDIRNGYPCQRWAVKHHRAWAHDLESAIAYCWDGRCYGRFRVHQPSMRSAKKRANCADRENPEAWNGVSGKFIRVVPWS